jgi:hypothetical protein
MNPARLGLGALLLAGAVAPAAADPASGVDAALFRPSYDTSGLFSLEGARLPPRRDLSWKMWLSYAQHPFDLAVPGIGDGGVDHVLGYDVTLDLAFGFTVSDRLGFGLAAAVYRADTGAGYGERGRFAGVSSTPSTGLISLRADCRTWIRRAATRRRACRGPLDVRLGGKYHDRRRPAAGGHRASAPWCLPFGEDEMFLGDHNLVFEPRLARRLAVRSGPRHQAGRQPRRPASASAPCSRPTTR